MGFKVAQLFVEIGARLKGFDEVLGKAEKGIAKLGERLAKAGTGLTIGLTAPLLALGGSALKAAIDFETAFASVRKNVDGTEAELAKLADGINELSTRIPATTKEIAAVASAAGQLGIQTANVLGFTEVMIKLGETTNLSADEAAKALARLANITRLPQSQFDRLGSTLLALGKSSASTESEILEMGLRIAGAGKQIGLGEAQILAFGAALSSVGIDAEAGGTAISRVFVEIAKAVDAGGTKLEDFASVAGMQASEFAEAFRTNAAGAVATFIEGIGRLEKQGRSTFQVLEGLEFENVRVRDALLRASNAGDLLRRSLDLAGGEWERNAELTETAQKRFQTTGAQLEILRNKLVLAAKGLGDALMPAFHSFLEVATRGIETVTQIVRGFSTWDEGSRKMVFVTGALVAALGPFLLALAATSKAIQGILIGVRLLTAHPLVALATLLAGLVLTFGAYTAGAKDAQAATAGLGQTSEEAAERFSKLTKEMKAAEISALEAKLARLRDGLAGITDPLQKLLFRDEIEAAEKLLQEMRDVADGTKAATEVIQEYGKSLEGIDKRFRVTGDAQQAMTEKVGLFERTLQQLLEVLPEEHEFVQITARLLREAKEAQTQLNTQVEKAAPLSEAAAKAYRDLGASLEAIRLTGSVLGEDPTAAIEDQIALTKQKIAELIAAGKTKGLSDEEILGTEGVQNTISQLNLLKGKLTEARFAFEDFGTSFKESFEELGAQLQVTGAEVADLLFGTFQAFAQGIGNAVAQTLFFAADIEAGLLNVLKQVGAQLVAALIALGIEQLAFMLLGLAINAKRTSAELASAAAITYAAAFAGASVGAIATGGIGLLAASGIAAAATGAMLVGAGIAGKAGAGLGATIPALAEGGLAIGPTLALVGEARPELILPVDRFHDFHPQERGNLIAHFEFDGRSLARLVTEFQPGIIRKKIGPRI